MMTAVASIFGVLPLALATGAGAGSRQSVGTTLFGGLLLGTVLGLAVIPVLYIMVQSTREFLKGSPVMADARPVLHEKIDKGAEIADGQA